MDAPRFDRMSLFSASLIALVLVSCGCKSDPYMDAYLDTVNAEKRSLEDTIYDLRYENEKLRKQVAKGGPVAAASDPAAAPDDGGFGPLVTPPGNDGGSAAPFIEPPANPDLTEPMTTPGVEVDPSEIFPQPTTSALRQAGNYPAGNYSASAVDANPAGTRAGSTTPSAMGTIASAKEPVTHLHINRSATRGRNTDGQAGDDVLMIGLELRDKYGRFVPSANPISVVLLDPQIEGAEARVAEWHFDSQQVAVGARHAGPTPMVLLEASWPKRPPKNSRLQLWARYTAPDGRILQTKQMIHISVDGQFSTRWTPRQRDAAARMATRPNAPDWQPNR